MGGGTACNAALLGLSEEIPVGHATRDGCFEIDGMTAPKTTLLWLSVELLVGPREM